MRNVTTSWNVLGGRSGAKKVLVEVGCPEDSLAVKDLATRESRVVEYGVSGGLQRELHVVVQLARPKALPIDRGKRRLWRCFRSWRRRRRRLSGRPGC